MTRPHHIASAEIIASVGRRVLPSIVIATLSCGCFESHALHDASYGPSDSTVPASGNASCTDRASTGEILDCIEVTGGSPAEVQALRSGCAVENTDGGPSGTGFSGSFANAACDRRHAVGGCRIGAETVWAYPPVTASDVRSTCRMNGGNYLRP